MEFDSVIEKRRSTRSFKPKRASWKDVLEAIDAASQAPFAGNMNHMKFIIIENPPEIEILAKLCSQSWITEAPIVLIACSDDTHLENLYGERGRVYSRQGAGAAIENLLLKLVDLGLAGCWVGSYTDELVKQHFNIPSQIQIEAVIPIGYEQKSTKSKPRKKKLENAIFWEKWDQGKRPTIFPDPSHRTEPEFT